MIGAESHDGGPQARGQFHPATIHWRRPDGGVGWLRLVHHAPTRAAASERPPPRGRVRRRCTTSGGRPTSLPLEVLPHRWRFPGLEVQVTTDAPLLDPATRTYAPTRHLTLDLR